VLLFRIIKDHFSS